MTLQPGSQLGNYEIVALIGAGGMGEVYKARDPKLGRLVAIKVLPAILATDRNLVNRFEAEARAVAALSHPNVLGIFDFVREAGYVYAVMEFLDGDNLREKLKAGPLPVKRTVEIAIEVAQGLGAAHATGIIHRDIKPENLFITREGRVKVLDFGLAKQLFDLGGDSESATIASGFAPKATEAGVVMGTVGYMSPEQVRGETADQRADVFAFGVVLFEMLTGQRPFKGDSPVQTMAAILELEPPELVTTRGPLPPALERIVSHCLEKRPEARFQSMKDVAFALSNLGTVSSTIASKPRPRLARPGSRPRTPLAAAGASLGTLALALVFWAMGWPPFTPKAPPTFTRLTFTPGTVEAALFGPDGRTIYFSERINGGVPELFVLHPGAQEPKPLGVTDSLLLGVSASSELAILRSPIAYYQAEYRGMLAQVGGEGGPIKEIQEHVLSAAWDGTGLATLITDEQDQLSLEFPAGKTLLKADPSARLLRLMRVSRGAEFMALVDSDGTSKSEVVVYDRAGQRRVLFTKPGDANGDTFTGLAWGPGDTLWYSELMGDQTTLWAQPRRGGRRRLLWRAEGTKALMDVSAEGRVLLANHQVRRGVLMQKAEEVAARDVSVASGSQAEGLSADGKSLLILESPILDGGTPQDRAYLSGLDGRPALKVAKGTPWTLSPDGQWLQMQYSGFEPKDLDPAVTAAFLQAGLDPRDVLDLANPVPYLLFVPTGAGHPFALSLPKGMEGVGFAFLHPDGKRVIFNSGEHGQSFWYEIDRHGGAPKVLTKPGYGRQFVGLASLSPDGSRLLVVQGNRFFVQDLAGGEPRLIAAIQKQERPLGWGPDGNSIYIRSEQWILPLTVIRLDLTTGARRKMFEFMPGDPSGILMMRSVFLPPGGQVCVLDYVRQISELYLVDGVH